MSQKLWLFLRMVIMEWPSINQDNLFPNNYIELAVIRDPGQEIFLSLSLEHQDWYDLSWETLTSA